MTGGDKLFWKVVENHVNAIHEVNEEKRLYSQTGKIWWVELKKHSLGYGKWLHDNCLVTRDGFRGSKPETWNIEMTNEEAYEMYLGSLKK